MKRGVEVFAFSSLYLTEWKKWIVYKKVSFKLQSECILYVKSIIEVRVIDSIIWTRSLPTVLACGNTVTGTVQYSSTTG